MLLALLLSSLASAGPPPTVEALRDARQDLTTEAFLAGLPPAPEYALGFDVGEADHYAHMVEQLELTGPERSALQRDGFAIVDVGQRMSMASAYYNIYARDLPVLVTTDSILHAMHRSFDDILAEFEAHVLLRAIDDVLARTHRAVVEDAAGAPLRAHRDLDLYLSVARALLAGEALELDEEMARCVRVEAVHTAFRQDARVADVIDRVQNGGLETPLTGGIRLYGRERMVDWTQFQPRGHYLESPDLTRYFQAMMWLGRADTGFGLEHDREVHAAVLLSTLMASCGALEGLEEVDRVLDWLVGPSDNLSPAGMLAALEAARLSPAGVYAPGAVASLRADTLGAQRIRSQVVVSDPEDPERVPPPAIYQVFGQRFVPDSLVLSEVVFDSIVFKGEKVERMMPSGLDVAAALGNNEAARILGETDLQAYPYAANLDASRAWIDGQPEGFWTGTATNTWLATLRHLHTDLAGERNAPAVMKGSAWQRKQLQTQLASWAEYRHDTVLYTKPGFTAYPACEYPAGFVEPYPRVYAGAAAFARGLADAMQSVDTERLLGTDHEGMDATVGMPVDAVLKMQERHHSFLTGFAARADWLEALSHKELAGERFSAEDTRLLKATIDIRGRGSGPPSYDGWYGQMIYGGAQPAGEWAPEVVTVHTDPEGGEALLVGTGDVDFVVAAIDNEGDVGVYVGPVSSYYETRWPVQDRLTDEAWGALIGTELEPARPAWMAPILHAEVKRTLGRAAVPVRPGSGGGGTPGGD